MGTGGAAVAMFFTALKTGNMALYLLTAGVILVGLIRIIDFQVYLNGGKIAKTRAHTRRREQIYAAGASMQALLLGTWGYVCLMQTRDDVAILMAMCVITANMVGVLGRNFALQKLVSVQTLLMGGLPVVALIARNDIYHIVIGALLLPFFFSVISIANNLRSNLLNATTRERDVTMLANQFDTALNNMPHGLCLFDGSGHLLVSNSLAEELFEIEQYQASNLNANSMIVELVSAKRISVTDGDKFLAAFDDGQFTKNGKLRILLDHQTTLEFSFRSRENHDKVVVFEDVTQRLVAEEKINQMARFDLLTGLANRANFQGQLHEAMRKQSELEEVGLMILDIDGFKQINDTLGQPVGDKLLRVVADQLRDMTSTSYSVSRLGSDEFVILMPKLRCREEASALAGMVVDRLAQSFMAAGHQIFIGVSVGISLATNPDDDGETLMRNADLALSKAKSDGPGSWRFYEPEMGAYLEERLRLETDLRQALASETLQVYYQPLVNLSEQKALGCEALVRWNHPQLGPISPGKFIPIAEEMGLIVELGEFVLNKACEDCAEWPNKTRVAVNLSAVQFRSGDLVNTVETALENSGLAPGRLELEITEGAMLHDVQETRAILYRLRDLGVHISLDDFGTGYSSLSYLHSLPLHKVKIDRSFIVELETNSRALIMLKNVAKLSEDLGLSIVVEGVETEEQLDIVRREVPNCEVQGFIFSPALPNNEITALLRAVNPASAHENVVKLPNLSAG